MANAPKAPESTPKVDWVVPNQNLFEQVIDARLAAHAESEKPAAKSTRSS